MVNTQLARLAKSLVLVSMAAPAVQANGLEANVTAAPRFSQLDSTATPTMQTAIPDAAAYGAKLLGTPCRVINSIGRKMIYQPPGMDYPILVLNSCTTGRLGSAIFVDYVKGTSTVVPLPSGSGGWDIIEVAPGKLLFESLAPLSLVTIDTTGGNYKVESNVEVAENAYAWSFSKGPQGEIYFGSYPTGHVYRYRPETKKVEDLGALGSAGNLYARFTAVDDRGYLIAAMGMTDKNIMAYNLATKEQTVVGAGKYAALFNVGGRVYAPIDGMLQQFDAAGMKFIKAELPPAPNGMNWHQISQSSTADRMILLATDGCWYEVIPNAAPRLVWNMGLRGGSIVGLNHTGDMIVFRGQEYAVAAVNDKDPQWRQVTGEAIPVAMHFISADPRGGVTGGPTFGQTLFRFDPARKLEQNTGQVVDGGGEVYNGLWMGDEFQFVAYSGGYQAKWNPNKPWNQWHNANPKMLAQFDAPKYGALIRPIGGLSVGPDNKLYSGWSGTYGTATGGLSEYDPATGEGRTWRNDVFEPEASIGKVASDGKYIYGLTSNEFNGIAFGVKPLYFWMFDPQSEKVLAKIKLDATHGANLMVIPGTRRVWLATAEGLRQFDGAKQAFVRTLPWPANLAKRDNFSETTQLGNNGWLLANDTIVKLEDGPKPTLRSLFTIDPGSHIAAGYDKKFYFTKLHELWAAPLQ